MTARILTGDCRQLLATLPDESVNCVVTSPPYFGLRDYGTAKWEGGDPACDHSYLKGGNGAASAKQVTSAVTQKYQYSDSCPKCGALRLDRQIGLESSLDAYLAELVTVFREVRRVLRSDGTCWLNIGDSYASSGGAYASGSYDGALGRKMAGVRRFSDPDASLKPKDLMMVPARLALALQSEGWWLRSDCIWHKKAPMPESVTDRPTQAHEHVFLLTKSAKYFYDADAVREPYTEPKGGIVIGRAVHGSSIARGGDRSNRGGYPQTQTGRNLRNVWMIGPDPFSGAHFATMPKAIAETCIKAGCPAGGTVLDPFLGCGTTLMVADRLGRNGIGIELSPVFAAMAEIRIRNDAPMFVNVEGA